MHHRGNLKRRPASWSYCDGIWVCFWRRRCLWRWSMRFLSFTIRSYASRILAGCSSVLIVGTCSMNVPVPELLSRNPRESAGSLIAEVGDIKFSVGSITHGDAGPLEPFAYSLSACIRFCQSCVGASWYLFNMLVWALISGSVCDCKDWAQPVLLT